MAAAAEASVAPASLTAQSGATAALLLPPPTPIKTSPDVERWWRMDTCTAVAGAAVAAAGDVLPEQSHQGASVGFSGIHQTTLVPMDAMQLKLCNTVQTTPLQTGILAIMSSSLGVLNTV